MYAYRYQDIIVNVTTLGSRPIYIIQWSILSYLCYLLSLSVFAPSQASHLAQPKLPTCFFCKYFGRQAAVDSVSVKGGK